MSKPTRKSLLLGNPEMVTGSRRRESLIKASGDSPNHHQRAKTKASIPKSIRNDLENTLVGLCDVWFEEIKPVLLRNNVKLHLHPAAGQESLRRGVGDCPHIDTGAAPTGTLMIPTAPIRVTLSPAASASSCELCRLLFNAASGIDSAMSQAALFASAPGDDPGNVGGTFPKIQDVGVQTFVNDELICGGPQVDSCPHTMVLKKIQEVYAAMSEVEESEPIRHQYKQKSLWSSTEFEDRCSRLSPHSSKEPMSSSNTGASNKKLTSPSPDCGVFDVLVTKKNLKHKRKATKPTQNQNAAIPTNHSIMQRRTATTTIPPHPRSSSRQMEQARKLIAPVDLVEKFGEKHGERLAVIYKSLRSEASSGIALLDSTCKKGQNTNTLATVPKKKPPWR